MYNQDDSAPCFRNRSNTWPRNNNNGNGNNIPELPVQEIPEEDRLKGGRRNIFGEFSYAALITKAILSSPEKKMTLSQIYDWMIENVPVLNNRPEGMASWKNSIRHNLSLHSKFVRKQYQRSGKCSYWTVDMEAKPAKTGRRRTGSMETRKLERSRQNARTFVQNAQVQGSAVFQAQGGSLPSAQGFSQAHISPRQPHVQTVNTTQSYVLPGFQMTSSFRDRTWSNESSCSRLSTIPSQEMLDIPDADVNIQNNSNQNYNDFRTRSSSYSSGSSGGKLSPEFSDQIKRTWYKTPTPLNVTASFQSAKSVIRTSDKEKNYDVLANNILYNMKIEEPDNSLSNSVQYNMKREEPTISNFPQDNINFYQEMDTGYQYAINIINREESRQIALDDAQSVDNIQIELVKNPLHCNIEEIISQDLKIWGSLDLNL